MIPQFQISTETGAADKKCGEASLRLLAHLCGLFTRNEWVPGV